MIDNELCSSLNVLLVIEMVRPDDGDAMADCIPIVTILDDLRCWDLSNWRVLEWIAKELFHVSVLNEETRSVLPLHC